jgi:hypothetical protein
MEKVRWSAAQIAHRKRVKAAGKFYREVLADPALKKRYQTIATKQGIPLSAVTLTEFMKRTRERKT